MFDKNKCKRENKKRKRWWLDTYKVSHGCKRCRCEYDSRLLELHHVNPLEKEIRPTHMVRNEWSIKKMLEELKKCIVLCKKCHILEHKKPVFGNSGIYIN